MSTKNKSLALTKTSSVPDALDVLKDQISKLKEINDTPYRTNKKITTANGQVDITTITDVNELRKAFSSVHARIKQLEAAMQELKITEYPEPKIDGSSLNDWKHDIGLRTSIIQYQDKFNKLNEMKKKWEELMDKEDRKAILVKEMEELVGASTDNTEDTTAETV